jgi:hypothetical protein
MAEDVNVNCFEATYYLFTCLFLTLSRVAQSV